MTDPSGAEPGATQATFCATLVDEWVRGGVRHAVVSPGSRSTPLALAVTARHELAVHVVIDERSAAFVALGIGRATGRPAVLVCTSGTAAANFHPAVVEAHQDHVPLIVCTADRPPELRDVGAPQTIDQIGLYGAVTRWSVDPGVADAAMASSWRSIAARTIVDACSPLPGPVHVNLPLRDPLVAAPGPLPAGRADGGPWHRVAGVAPALDDEALASLVAVLDVQRGVIVAGADAPREAAALGERIGWPVLADPRSRCRVPAPAVIAAFDALVRQPDFAREHRPDVVVRLGPPPASKVLATWLAASQARQVVISPHRTWSDPDHAIATKVHADPAAVCRALGELVTGGRNTPWLARWRNAEARAQRAIDAVLATMAEPTEPAIARLVARSVPDGGRLVVSSSMPVRDVEWFSEARDGIEVVANRGANGIDGVTSTAIGVALADPERPVVALIGDVAFVHDASALVALGGRAVRLSIVVVDNDGGGIFSFLPQRSAVDASRFEQLFGTPHGTNVVALAAAHGIDATELTSMAALDVWLADRSAGRGVAVALAVVRTNRDRNVAVHDELTAAVASAVANRG